MSAASSRRKAQHTAAERDAKVFIDRRSRYPSRAKAVSPSLEELKSRSFTEYVQSVLFCDDSDNDRDSGGGQNLGTQRGAGMPLPEFVNSNSVKNSDSRPPAQWKNGIVKITLPEGWWDEAGIANDRTGRGAAWQRGTKLGDLMVRGPIKQKLAGIGGIYEYALFDQPAMTLADFRDMADKYRKSQVGIVMPDDYDSDDACDEIARKFWKRLGPTMRPSIYGADMEGSLFEGSEASGWSLENLDNSLQLLAAEEECDHLPGVTTPYLYVGMWASVFCAHTEDMNLLSINYLHAGAPKYWYAIAPEHAKRFESLAEFHFAHASQKCPEFLRHKLHLLSPRILEKNGVPFEVQIQRPGDAIITCAGAYHFGVNLGFNVAEATNFAVEEWIPKGREAQICMCRPHSVRIDMERFEWLCQQYKRDMMNARRLGFPTLTYKQWTMLEKKRRRMQAEDQQHHHQEQPSTVLSSEHAAPQAVESSSSSSVSTKKKKAKKKEPIRVTTNNLILNTAKDFWVEVMRPMTTDGKLPTGKKRKRNAKPEEEWRLARPLGGKDVALDMKVLCLMKGKLGDDPEDEQCFAGVISEIAEGHARIHFAGLAKKEDIWMKVDSPRLFLDGGKYEEGKEYVYRNGATVCVPSGSPTTTIDGTVTAPAAVKTN